VRPAAVHVRRSPPPARLGAPRGGAGRGLTALAEALVRHPPPGRRGRFAGNSGAFGTCVLVDDAGLHSSRVRSVAHGLLPQPSAGLRGAEGLLETNVKAIELKELWRRYREQGDQ